jgi:hypothetical protein
MRPQDVAYAEAVLLVGAEALARLAGESAGVVCGDLPTLTADGAGGVDVAVLFLWPGWLLELGPCGELAAKTHASQMHEMRPRAAMHLVSQTCGVSLLRAPIGLPCGGAGEAVFKANGRVLIRNQGGRVLARSLPGRPAELDSLFSPPPAPMGAA